MIVKNKILIPKRSNDYMEVRSLAIKGSDFEIGKDLAEIGMKEYGVALEKYKDAVYGRARQSYMRKNIPVLAERSRGVAEAFGLRPEDTSYDTTMLPFDGGEAACSAIYFPPSLTENNHPCVCRNLDWYTASFAEMVEVMTGIKGKSEPGTKSFSRVVAVECYPDDGCKTLQLGSHDLLNPFIDGFNEKGLFVTMLVDLQGVNTPMIPPAGGRDTGMSFSQLHTMLLNTCATVEEAKLEILQQRIYFPFRGQHFLIADLDGNVTLFEVDGQSGLYYFIDGKPNEPFIVTNHAVHLYPDPSTFPQYDPNEKYNSFNRWNRLAEYLKNHNGVYSKEDMYEAMSFVYAHYRDVKAAGGALPFPGRTLWTYIADLEERKMEVKFYRHDASVEPGSQDPTLVFHDPITLGFYFQ
ncbi:MAG TPA: C45 family peptidase [Candidatus Acidoferrales bacterium]|nr:C45 family peptidase [Candidatus Acidoferrales bacterium]